jgi:protein tyrosine phosphatase (PTP) superfamily phosphohydrolase (DUF442 family)
MRRTHLALASALAAGVVLLAAACSSTPAKPASVQPTLPPPTVTETAPRDYPGIHNAVAYHDDFISGSVPEGDAGFDTLQEMGIKTIISVDGAVPDVAAAEARGMRYIHLPIGYNGFDETRKLQLVRATRDALKDGPVYIHCHHGKHRSAGAAAAVAVSMGWDTPDQAVARMKVSGTAPNYTGLYACAADATVLTAASIDAVDADFPSVSRPNGFVAAMVEVDEVFDHLKLIEKAGWKTPADHPDLVPAAEAGRLADLFRLSAQGDYAKRKPADFGTALGEEAKRASTIEELLLAAAPDAARLSAQFKLIGASCKECHAKYRD